MRLGLGLGLVRLGKAMASFVRDGLKLYYPFKDNSPELLLSGATSFDGTDDYIQLASDGRTDFANQSFTISAWIKPSTVGSNNTIFSYDFTSHASPYYAMHFRTMSSGRITLNYNNGAGNSDGLTSGNDVITAGVWQHVSATYTSGTQKLYVNGSVVASGTHSHTITFYDQEVWIGKANFSDSEFTGSLANVGIWNRALSSSEIESIYWKGQYADLKGTELTNLISWYNLKDTVLGSELVTNGDNEAGLVNLSPFRVALSQSTEQSYDGDKSCKVVANSANDTHYARFALTANKTYKATGFVYLPSGQTISSLKVGYDNNGDNQFAKFSISSTNQWVSFEVDIPSASSYSYFTFGGASGSYENNYWYIDNVSVKEILATDSQGTNEGTIVGATTLTDAYSASSPFLPRIQDKASDTVANYGEVYGGNAVSFDGASDYISIADSDSLSFGDGSTDSAFTVSAWVKMDDANEFVFINKGTYNSNGEWIFATNNEDKISFWTMDESVASCRIGREFTTAITSYENQWIHLAGTYNGNSSASGFRIYLNGSRIDNGDKVSNASSYVAMENQGADVYVGRYSSIYSNGSINNVKIFNTALTQDQVRELYTKPELTLPTGIASSALKLDMPMQEGSGVAILDGSPTTSDDFITGFVNGSSYPLDSFATNGDDITLFTESASFGGAVSNTFEIVNGNKYLIEFNYTHISGDGVRVVLTNTNTGAGAQISNNITLNSTQTVQSIFTATASSSVGRLQIGTGSGSHSVNCTISNASVKLLGLGQNHGTGSGITWATGQEYGFQHPLVRSNNPMVFDGSDDNVGLSDPSTLDFSTGDWTISTWVKQENANASSNQGIISKYGTHPSITLMADNDNARIFIFTAGGSRSVSSSGLSDGNWHHVVATHDQDGATTLYVDSVNKGTSTTSIDSLANNNDWKIGSRDASANYFNGLINDVAIWGLALTANEVTALYNSGLPLLPTADSGNYASRDDLVGYWRNDGVTTWTDRSTNSNNGTVSGSPASIIVPEGLNEGRDSQGYYLTDTDSISSGIRLKGAEYISVQDSESLDLGTSDFTLECWLKTTSQGYLRIMDKRDASSGFTLNVNTSEKINLELNDGSGNSGFSGNTAVNDGNWHHVVVSADRSANAKFYLDGALDDTDDISAKNGSLNSVSTLFIGADAPNGDSLFFNGSIDEVRIYKGKALSATEVLKNYNNGKSAHSN